MIVSVWHCHSIPSQYMLNPANENERMRYFTLIGLSSFKNFRGKTSRQTSGCFELRYANKYISLAYQIQMDLVKFTFHIIKSISQCSQWHFSWMMNIYVSFFLGYRFKWNFPHFQSNFLLTLTATLQYTVDKPGTKHMKHMNQMKCIGPNSNSVEHRIGSFCFGKNKTIFNFLSLLEF